MKRIALKLTLAFLAVAVIAALLVTFIIYQTNPARLNQMLREQSQAQLEGVLAEYYVETGSYDGVGIALAETGYFPEPPAGGMPPNSFMVTTGVVPGERMNFALADGQGMVIVSTLPEYRVGSVLPYEQLAMGETLSTGGVSTGTLFLPGRSFALTEVEQNFLRRTNQALGWAALGAVGVALAGGLLLARSFSRPLQELTQAARRMAGGELQQQVAVKSKDEIGQLTEAFNSMSRSVTRANELRRQMTADIAHDLRTPLTVVGGYIESMQEGVLAPTPERLEMIHGEIEHLQRLVEDLRTLSRADAGELTLVRQDLEPRALLERLAGVYQHSAQQKGIALKVEAGDDLVPINADEERMVQVLGNLVDNALRHTPAGGGITLRAEQEGERVRITVEDTGEGIRAEDLPHVFERFYRADRARQGDAGASGLGLAIARAIVTAHGGTLQAESEEGRGTRMILDL